MLLGFVSWKVLLYFLKVRGRFPLGEAGKEGRFLKWKEHLSKYNEHIQGGKGENQIGFAVLEIKMPLKYSKNKRIPDLLIDNSLVTNEIGELFNCLSFHFSCECLNALFHLFFSFHLFYVSFFIYLFMFHQYLFWTYALGFSLSYVIFHEQILF